MLDLLVCRPAFLGDRMVCKFWLVIPAVMALIYSPAIAAQTGTDVVGIWLTQAGDAKVRVRKCGEGICGVIVWLKDPISPATGKPQVDDKNPSLRSSRECSRPVRTSGRVASTTPTTATPTPATFRFPVRAC